MGKKPKQKKKYPSKRELKKQADERQKRVRARLIQVFEEQAWERDESRPGMGYKAVKDAAAAGSPSEAFAEITMKADGRKLRIRWSMTPGEGYCGVVHDLSVLDIKKHETDPDDPAAVLWRGGLFNTIRFLSEGAPPGWNPRAEREARQAEREARQAEREAAHAQKEKKRAERAEKKALAKATAKNSISIHTPHTGHDLPV